MTLYLTDQTSAEEIERAHVSGVDRRLQALSGRRDHPFRCRRHRRRAARSRARGHERACDLPLLVHGEVTDPKVDVFDREARFIERVLAPLCAALADGCAWCSSTSPPRDAVEFVRSRAPGRWRHGHAAASDAQSQCLVCRRHAPAPITACRCSRPRPTAPSLLEVMAAAIRAFSSAPTAPRTRARPRRAAAAAPGFSQRTRRSSCMRRSSRPRACCRGCRALPREFGADFYRLPRNQADPSRWSRSLDGAAQAIHSATGQLVPLARRRARRLAPEGRSVDE